MKYAALMYHELSTGELKGRFWVSLDLFKRQLDYLDEHDFAIPTLRDIGNVTGKKVLITLDDGHGSNFAAAEELSRRGKKGVFYILKDKSLGDSEYLTEAQIKEISAMGHEIGVHGKDHKFWTLKGDAQLRSEIAETKSWLEELIGRRIETCSAPGGKIDSRVVRLIKSSFPDLRYIRTSRESYNKDVMKSRLLNCVAIRSGTTMKDFAGIVNVSELTHLRLLSMYYAKGMAKRIIGR